MGKNIMKNSLFNVIKKDLNLCCTRFKQDGFRYYFADSLVDFIYIFLLCFFSIFALRWSIGEPMNFLGLISPANEKQFLINNILMEIFGISFVILFGVLFFLIFCIEIQEPRNYHMPSFNFSEFEENFLDSLFILIPTFLIYCMLIPTLGFLYQYDLMDSPNADAFLFEIHIIGRQWFWEYTYHLEAFIPIIAPFVDEKDLTNWNFMIQSCRVRNHIYNNTYLLGVDNPLVVPIGYPILLTISGEEVIHSFFVPTLGLKLDGIPGKQACEFIQNNWELTLFGQCAELCGVEHGFMPIQIDWIPFNQWCCWIALQTNYIYN